MADIYIRGEADVKKHSDSADGDKVIVRLAHYTAMVAQRPLRPEEVRPIPARVTPPCNKDEK